VLDGGEECDDGNLIDQDACLATCKFNVCGDTFLNAGVEQCDDLDFGRATCTTLGFAAGALACTKSCTFDTSGCTGISGSSTPTPTATPNGPTSSTPSGGPVGPTPSGPAPTATPPSGTSCSAGEQIVVMASVGKPYGGISFRLAYPPAANIPGNGTAQSVKDRVVFAHVGGIQVANDLDNNADGVDETLRVGTVNTSESPAGLFITATFDCIAGQVRPAASDFSCQVQSASTPDGIDIPDETCSLTVE
jgi:cysteine-rich repeat protein